MNQVIKMLTLYLGVDRQFLMAEYKFEELKQIKFEVIDEKIMKKL